ncbi:hypothetical protein SSP24_83280 [Streptomyces spinoverrucosus]|uniref:Amidohydrolase 3 domain-containing protein n=1 Tax=Streptomyces spinoverrucosus TaxID=284043 RepID=A0A4Y3VVI2_9ACTN|nr:hypothetical protein SSP24_83280 [Streptomyces spinoverrucosus]
MLREQAGRTPKGQWVRVVGGRTADQFAERRLPTVAELNAAASDSVSTSRAASGTVHVTDGPFALPAGRTQPCLQAAKREGGMATQPPRPHRAVGQRTDRTAS